ncbi:MAG: hypothetical protein R3F62_30080 [Planctomycetota bacterium]
MGDERLQRLRRDDQDAPEARARLLRERLRAGELSEGEVRLAAFAGDLASQAALAAHPVCWCGITRAAPTHARTCPLHPRRFVDTPDARRHPRSFRPWLRALQQWPRAVGVRACLGVVHALWTPDCDAHALATLWLVEDWALCPCLEHLSSVPRERRGLRPQLPPLYALDLVLFVLRLQWERDPVVAGAAVAASALERCAQDSSEERVRAAIYEALVPWALGEGDPLAQRVAARPAGLAPPPPSEVG